VQLKHLHHGETTGAVCLAVETAGHLIDLTRMGDFPAAADLAVSWADLLWDSVGDARELLAKDPARFRGRYDRLPEGLGGARKASLHETGLAVAEKTLESLYNAVDPVLWADVVCGEVARFDHAIIRERWATAAPQITATAPAFNAGEAVALIQHEASLPGQPEERDPDQEEAIEPTDETLRAALAMLDEGSRRILDLSKNRSMSADDRMRAIAGLDRRCWAWNSTRWAELLNVEGATIRQTRFWRVDRVNRVEQERESY